MIVCPNCKHDNPEGATSCEACYTALPATKACPSCGASIQLEATFCGQCGHNLKTLGSNSPILLPPPLAAPTIASSPESAKIGLPETVLTVPAAEISSPPINVTATPAAAEIPPTTLDPIEIEAEIAAPVAPLAAVSAPVELSSEPAVESAAPSIQTPLPVSTHQLLHLQTNTILELLPHLPVIHLGKPNDRIAPDIDVSAFPCAEVVSRIHANISVDAENYYIEDIGSANGTYINHNVLAKGNRHLLRSGDRIGLGKGDLVTFIFQLSDRS